MQITIYTDGACDIHASDQPGGWAAILVAADENGKTRKETVFSGGKRMTTNNQMELMAVIEALKQLTQPAELTIVSDSRYVIDIASGKKQARANKKLWREYHGLALPHDIKWVYVAGHTGHAYNERCDRLAVQEKNKLARPRKSDADESLARASDIKITLSTRYLGAKKRCAWAAIVEHGDQVSESSGIFINATEQETILRAACLGLEALPADQSVTVFTAQQYLAQGMKQWTRNWMATGWKTRDGKPVKYRGHWQALVKLSAARPIDFVFVRERDQNPHFARGAALTSRRLADAD